METPTVRRVRPHGLQAHTPVAGRVPIVFGKGMLSRSDIFNGEGVGDIDEFERGQIDGAEIKSQSSAIGISWFKESR